jgi:type IV fimbrial biogenesis protein FimT
MLRRSPEGFSLIELMVGLAVFAMLLAVGIPSLQAYSLNNRILSTAQSFVSGIQTARAEAIRRNTTVQFMLTDSDNLTSPNNATPSSTGMKWVVFDPNTSPPLVLDARGLETNAATVSVSMVDSAATPAPVASITFNSLGGTSLGSVAVMSVTAVGQTCNSAATPSDVRCINVIVTPGGRSQLCDPAATAATDSRRCIYS